MNPIGKLLVAVLSVGVGVGAENWQSIPGNFVQVSTDGKQICGVTAANTAFCSATITNPTWRLLPGRFVSVAVSGDLLWAITTQEELMSGKSKDNPEFRLVPGVSAQQVSAAGNWTLPTELEQLDVTADGIVSGVKVDGTAYSGPAEALTSLTNTPALKQLVSDGLIQCGLTKTNDVLCSNNAKPTTWVKLAGQLTQLDMQQGQLVGVTKAGDVKYITDLPVKPAPSSMSGPPKSAWSQLPGLYAQVSFDGKTLCAISASSQILCATEGLDSKPKWRQVPGNLRRVIVLGDYLVGLGIDGRIYRASIDTAQWRPVAGPNFVQISTDGNFLCGTTQEGAYFLATGGSGWDVWSNPRWSQLFTSDNLRVPSSGKQIVLHDSTVFMVDSKNSIFVGLGATASRWFRMPGTFKSVDFDGKVLCATTPDDKIFYATAGWNANDPNWKPMDGTLASVVSSGNVFFGLGSNGTLWYRRGF